MAFPAREVPPRQRATGGAAGKRKINLRTESVGLIILVLAPVLGGFHVIVDWVRGDITTSLGSVYAQKQVLYSAARGAYSI